MEIFDISKLLLQSFHNYSKIFQNTIIQAPKCSGTRLIANEVCDNENNNIICHYDGGDCCGSNATTGQVFSRNLNDSDSDTVLPVEGKWLTIKREIQTLS